LKSTNLVSFSSALTTNRFSSGPSGLAALHPDSISCVDLSADAISPTARRFPLSSADFFSFYGNDGTKFSKKRTAIESVLPNRLPSGNQKRFWRDPTMLAHIATTESVSLCTQMKS
jgi:hypothetical protein